MEKAIIIKVIIIDDDASEWKSLLFWSLRQRFW